MIYTIAIMQDIQNGQVVTLDKNGANFTVWLQNTDKKEKTRKNFESIDDAYTVFEKLSHAIITGCYSYGQRKAMLA